MLPQEQALCLFLLKYYGTTFHFIKPTLIKSMTYVRLEVDSVRIWEEFDKLGLARLTGLEVEIQARMKELEGMLG